MTSLHYAYQDTQEPVVCKLPRWSPFPPRDQAGQLYYLCHWTGEAPSSSPDGVSGRTQHQVGRKWLWVSVKRCLRQRMSSLSLASPSKQPGHPVPLPWKELEMGQGKQRHLKLCQVCAGKKGRVKDVLVVVTPMEDGLGGQEVVRRNNWTRTQGESNLKPESCSMGRVGSSWMRLLLWCKGTKGSWNCGGGSQQGSKSTGASVFAMRIKSKKEARFVRKRNCVLKRKGWGEQIAMKLQFVTVLT